MKKIAILLGAVILTGSVMAQKPSSDDAKFSLEGMINYDNNNGISWNAPNLRARYFVNDNIAARITLGLSAEGQSLNAYEFDGSGTGTVDVSDMGWSLSLGAEYHLGGTDKLSPYFSAGIMLGGLSSNVEASNADYDYDEEDGWDAYYIDDFSASSEVSASMFGIGLGAGIDYYVFDNVYLGLELGFSWMNVSDKGGSDSSTSGGETTTTTYESTGSASSTSIGGGELGFRIGWRF